MRDEINLSLQAVELRKKENLINRRGTVKKKGEEKGKVKEEGREQKQTEKGAGPPTNITAGKGCVEYWKKNNKRREPKPE